MDSRAGSTWLAVHILYLTGFQNRALVLFQWAWAYITYQLGARLILSAPETVSSPGTTGAAAPAQALEGAESAPPERPGQVVQSEQGVA
jgi:hypothetical protein